MAECASHEEIGARRLGRGEQQGRGLAICVLSTLEFRSPPRGR